MNVHILEKFAGRKQLFGFCTLSISKFFNVGYSGIVYIHFIPMPKILVGEMTCIQKDNRWVVSPPLL